MKKLLIVIVVALTACTTGYTQKMTLSGECRSTPDGGIIYLRRGKIVDRQYQSFTVDSAVVRGGKFQFALNGVEPDEYVLMRATEESKEEVMLLISRLLRHISGVREVVVQSWHSRSYYSFSFGESRPRNNDANQQLPVRRRQKIIPRIIGPATCGSRTWGYGFGLYDVEVCGYLSRNTWKG